MKDNFNIIYESIKKTLLEQISVSTEITDDSKYEFKKDKNENVLCTFSLIRDGEDYSVLAKYFNHKTSFAVTYPSGNTKQFNEREFAKEFYKDYDDYREAFDKYIDSEENQEKDAYGNTQITPFSDVLSNSRKNSKIKDEKEYEINGINFLFRILKDELVTSFCECLFQIPDEETSEIIHYKVLISIKPTNSIIIKIIKFNDKDEMIGLEYPSILQEQNKELYDNLFLAIRKMEKYIKSEKKFI